MARCVVWRADWLGNVYCWRIGSKLFPIPRSPSQQWRAGERELAGRRIYHPPVGQTSFCDILPTPFPRLGPGCVAHSRTDNASTKKNEGRIKTFKCIQVRVSAEEDELRMRVVEEGYYLGYVRYELVDRVPDSIARERSRSSASNGLGVCRRRGRSRAGLAVTG